VVEKKKHISHKSVVLALIPFAVLWGSGGSKGATFV